MERSRALQESYDWMLTLSAEGWAWEFLRRNPDYRKDYLKCGTAKSRYLSEIATHWGLLNLPDPGLDARTAVVFWTQACNPSVLSLVIAGDSTTNGLSGLRCRTSTLESALEDTRHVLFSSEGRFLQLTISGAGPIHLARYLTDALSEQNNDRRIIALRRLADLAKHKRLRQHLYSPQRRAPRLAHIAEVLDSYARNSSHRSVARDVYGEKRADDDWESIKDHIRRAIAAGQKLTRQGYLELLA